jgi:FMN-dependent NADH-azoreductase
MSTLLQIFSSMNGANGVSSQLVQRFTAEWLIRNPGGQVATRDLSRDLIPHLSADSFQGFRLEPSVRTVEQQQTAQLSDELIAELNTADVIAIGVPMYNFSIPSTLRAYFDHIARAGVTFRYTSAGPEGLLRGKRAVIFVARGGRYGEDQETQTAYLRQFLGFLGIKEVDFVYAEGLSMGEESTKQSLREANRILSTFAQRHDSLAA